MPNLNEQISIGGRENLLNFMNQSQGDLGQAPGLGQLLQLLQSLQGERAQLGQRMQAPMSATPEQQALAHQAAFQPLEGLRPTLDAALLQAANAATSRGLGRGSISAALQAQAVPQIMGPALANAQGLESQMLLDIPFRERQMQGQFGLQSLGLGGELAGQQMGLRQSVFANLAQAIEQSRAERGFKSQQNQQGGFGRALGGLAGGLLGSFLGPVGAGLGAGLGKRLFSSGSQAGNGAFASGGAADTGAEYYWGPNPQGNYLSGGPANLMADYYASRP